MLAAIGAYGYWFCFMRGLVSTEDARLDGDLVDVAPQITGVLDKVLVGEGERVKQGQVLFVLNKELLEATLSKALASESTARARLAMAQSELEKILSGPRPAEIQIAEAAAKRAGATLNLATADWSRFRNLYKGKVASGSERDKARSAYETARYAHDEAVEKLSLLREGSREEDIRTGRANLEMAKAQLAVAAAEAKQARVNLSYAEVCAPFDGLVVRKWQNPGAMTAAGRPVLSLFNPDTLYVSANVEEKNLSRIHPGDRVDIKVDAFPDLELTGRLDKVMVAANSEFSLIPSEGVSGTYIKVAQRIPIRITLNPHPDLSFGPGLSATIDIHVRENDFEQSQAVSRE